MTDLHDRLEAILQSLAYGVLGAGMTMVVLVLLLLYMRR